MGVENQKVMAKFNVVQKRRRAAIAEKKRAVHGDPITGKLKIKPQPQSISGKRKRKVFKKWRRDQKDAVDKGLITMEDVEMAVAEGTPQDKTPKTFSVKKALKLKQLKNKGKKKKNGKPAAAVSVDSMVE